MNIEDIEGLEDRLDTKADVVHPHATSDITGLVEILAEKAPLDHTHDISDFPDISDAIGQSFAPSVHQHTIEQVTGLQGALNLKSNTGHGHSIAQVTGLQTALDGKSSNGHGHEISQVTGLQTALAAKSDDGHKHPLSDIEGVDEFLDGSFAPADHDHDIADVDGLQDALNAKSDDGHTHSIAQVTGLQTSLEDKANSTHFHPISQVTGLQDALDAVARVNPDWDETDSTDPAFIANKPTLGTAALCNVGTGANDVATGNHTHDAAQITSGVLSIDRLPVIPGTKTIVSFGGFDALTESQLAQIVEGTNVALSNGSLFVYTGVGDKALEANYLRVSRNTVDYSAITNAPGNATPTAAGLMSAADKGKLDGVAVGANNYVHPDVQHVPATGTSTNGRVLKSGNTANSAAWGTLTASEVGAAASTHSHGNITSDGKIGTTVEGLPVVTGANGVLQAGTSTTFAAGTHTHGNITSDGRMTGVASRSLLLTGTDGTINTLSVGTGNSGRLLQNNGPDSAPSWEVLPSHTHGNITNAGAVGSTANRVLVTGTGGAVTALATSGTTGQVLVSKGANAAPAWETPTTAEAPTSVANLSGGNTGSIPYQSAVGTTAFLDAPATPPTTGYSFLETRGTANSPAWRTVGNIVTKAQGDYVATVTDTSGTISKIRRMTASGYQTLNPKDASTLYVIVG